MECPDCGGDGRETCSNPDHGFIAAVGGDIGRLGCPCCGYDPDHKVPGGGKCGTCNGTGEIEDMSEANTLPTDAAARGEYPMADGLLYYFPAALAEVSRVSKIGNDQHNPGEPLHWARDKSTDHANKIMRHLVDAGSMDSDGTRHSAKLAWRALALLQEELEREQGAPLPRNARFTLPPAERVVEWPDEPGTEWVYHYEGQWTQYRYRCTAERDCNGDLILECIPKGDFSYRFKSARDADGRGEFFAFGPNDHDTTWRLAPVESAEERRAA